MSKFKVGDLVVIRSNHRDYEIYNGMCGEICSIKNSELGYEYMLESLPLTLAEDEIEFYDVAEHKPDCTDFKQDLCGKLSATDAVRQPSHYTLYGTETITIIARNLTQEEWRGYCLGNTLKYRLRAGKKGDAATCLAKADFYEELYETHKELCKK